MFICSRPCPSIVDFYDAYVDKQRDCVSLVMQYMSAGSMQDVVLGGGCTSEAILSRMAYCILKGLSHIHHKNCIHRDIKPHNLLLNKRVAQSTVSDFGLAKTLNEHATQTKTFVGTLMYMAPERVAGEEYSFASDIWSFGLSLISVALGKYPLPANKGFFDHIDSVRKTTL